MPSSSRSAPASTAASHGGGRLVEARVAAHQVRHQGGALAVRAERFGDAHLREHLGQVLVAAAEASLRLSPGPGFAKSHAIACEDSSAGRMPSSAATRWKASRGAVLDGLVPDPAGVAQPRVLGADAGIVEPGRDRCASRI